jgi:hypothetical protein
LPLLHVHANLIAYLQAGRFGDFLGDARDFLCDVDGDGRGQSARPPFDGCAAKDKQLTVRADDVEGDFKCSVRVQVCLSYDLCFPDCHIVLSETCYNLFMPDDPIAYVRMMVNRAIQLLEKGDTDAALVILKEILKFLNS